jgi:membrane associated rhomboid family serine protease
LLFYLFCGVVAGVTQSYSAPVSRVPMVGASGAIAGVTGAYFVNFPHARVLTLVPVFFFIQMVYIPAVVFLLLWFVLQLAYGAASFGMEGADVAGVAWWAHVGGFMAGMILGRVLIRRSRSPRYA